MFRGVDPGGGGPVTRRGDGHRRQDGVSFPRPEDGQAIQLVSPWASPELVEGQHGDIGEGKEGGEVQRGYRNNQLTGDAETGRLPGYHRRHGLPEGDSPGDCGPWGEYLLAVKDNQGQFYQDERDLFEAGDGTGLDGLHHHYATTLNKGHGRIERRECWAMDDQACLEYLGTVGEWPWLRSGMNVHCQRETEAGVTVQARYHIKQPGGVGGAAACGGPGPLEHGRYFPGGPEPCAQGPRTSEHGNAAPNFPLPAETGDESQSGHTGEKATGRMAGGLTL